MLELIPNFPNERRPSILFIGAHCDDIEIGCGGTVLELMRRYPKAQIRWVVLSSYPRRLREARRAARLLLGRTTSHDVRIENFRGAYFPTEFSALKDYFESLKQGSPPDLVFTHFRDDLHQDHRVVSELTWNTFRNHFILEYEIPKYDGGLGSPALFVPIGRSTLRRKVDVLMRAFESQHDKQWFTPDTFMGLMRLRGIECNSPTGYAEAFYCRKLLLGTRP